MKNKSCFTGILDVNKIMSFPKFVVGNLLLSGSLLKEEKKTLFYAESGRSPNPAGRHPSGMTILFYNGNYGFTLIELLVVVLIIGILAAVALPQYKMAVVKARVGTVLPLMKAISQAQEAYYMANGTYTYISTSNNPTDIEFTGCTQTNPGNTSWNCGNNFLLDFNGSNYMSMVYCPGYNTYSSVCSPHKEFQIFKYYQHPNSSYAAKAGKWECVGTTSLGQKVCGSLVLN